MATKKNYSAPEFKLIVLVSEDIITDSPGGGEYLEPDME